MGHDNTKDTSCFSRVRIAYENALSCFAKKYRRVIIKNRVAHIVELIVKIKKETWKKHPSVENHAQLILATCDLYTPESVDNESCEIICAACLFIGECLDKDILKNTRIKAIETFEHFKCYKEEVSSDELKVKFKKWFSQ